jgi:ParB-like chromosome segregation protein Spo0J
MSETRPIQELRDHPQAALVPFMTSGEYRSFLADVSERGIVDPIQITSQRVVLDGRHRLRAARDLGFAAVPVRVVEPVDEVSYMLLAAFSRRQAAARKPPPEHRGGNVATSQRAEP